MKLAVLTVLTVLAALEQRTALRYTMPGMTSTETTLLSPGRQRPRQDVFLDAAQACQELPCGRVRQHLGVGPRAPAVVPRRVVAPLPVRPRTRFGWCCRGGQLWCSWAGMSTRVACRSVGCLGRVGRLGVVGRRGPLDVVIVRSPAGQQVQGFM